MKATNKTNQTNKTHIIIKNRDSRNPRGPLLSHWIYLPIFLCSHRQPSPVDFPSPRPAFAECGPPICPDWYAAGMMTGSGWFDSAHGLQVYHFYPFTPLALRLGVVFYFLDVMPMFCPYPTTCEWDDFHKAGRHLCLRVKCPYQLTAKAMLEQEIRFLAQIRRPTADQVLTLEKLRKQYKEAFEK